MLMRDRSRPVGCVKEFGVGDRDVPVVLSPTFDDVFEDVRARIVVAEAEMSDPIEDAAEAYELATATLQAEIERLDAIAGSADQDWLDSDAGYAHASLRNGLAAMLLVFDPENMRQIGAMAAEARAVCDIALSAWMELEPETKKGPDL